VTAWLLVHLLRHPFTRLWPSFLKHKWIVGLLCVMTLYINFVAPFILVGQYFVGVTSFCLTSMVVFLWKRELLEWIIVDLRNHKANFRGLFQHSSTCPATHHVHAHNNTSLTHGEHRSRTELDLAIGKGLHYLEARKQDDGLWHDFSTLAGEGVDWVSGFVP
jgi:hypothetical protein